MSTVTLHARAKLNWTLDVKRRREDGYHDVDMLMQSIDLYDTLTISLGGKKVDVICEYPFTPNGDANIACRSAELFLQEMGITKGAHVHIKKRIPVAAGLAGGSTDAAGVLVGLNALCDEPLTNKELQRLGVRIGADVPFCITGGLQRAQGIGEVLTPIRAGSVFYVVLVKPEGRVYTNEVYQALDLENLEFRPDNQEAAGALEAGDAFRLAGALGNVLRGVTHRICPDVDNLCDLLEAEGALGVNMTGSGPTVFGVFEKFEEALHSLRAIRHRGAEWCCAVSTADRGITFDE
ncbi:MAG: 4-(cytidine 5'-diphospho)-2-C-methyl-D-erythritol kinase [Bacillota bacterium]